MTNNEIFFSQIPKDIWNYLRSRVLEYCFKASSHELHEVTFERIKILGQMTDFGMY